MNASNASSSSSTPWYHNPSWNWFQWNIFVWLFPLMCSVGAFFNISSFIVIVRNANIFPYVTRQYMLILTFSDSLSLTLISPWYFLRQMNDRVTRSMWADFKILADWSPVMCPVYFFLGSFVFACTPFYQMGLTVDRLLAVAVPLKAKTLLTRRRSWWMLACLVLMSVTTSTIFAANTQWSNGQCGIRDLKFYVTFQSQFNFYFNRVIPLLLLLVSSCVIVGILVCRRGRVSGSSSGGDNGRLVRLTMMLLFMNATFIATTLPFSAAIMITPQVVIGGGSTQSQVVFNCFQLLLYVNSSINWICLFFGSGFRRAFCRQFCRSNRVAASWFGVETVEMGVTGGGVTRTRSG